MFGLFKKKMSAEEAAAVYLHAVAVSSLTNWRADARRTNEVFGRVVLDENSKVQPFEFLIAMIALELNVVKNRIPEHYNIISQSLYQFLEKDENTGEYAVSSIRDEYLPEIRHAESGTANPFDGILTILFDKLEIQYDTLVAILFTEMIASKLGTWKNIINEYKIV